METAKIIYEQIKAIDVYALMAWGSSNFRGQDNTLGFTVRGLKMKGQVFITLDEATDMYNIEFYKGLSLPKLYKKIEGVFCDELVKTIDEVIEK